MKPLERIAYSAIADRPARRLPGGKRLALVPKLSYSSERRQPENLFNW